MEKNKIIVVSLDSGALIVEFNEYAQELTGYSKDDVIGKNWFEIFIPDSNMVEVLEVFRGVFSGDKQYWEFTNDITLKDGTKKMIKWNNAIIKDENNRAKYIYSLGVEVN